MSPKKHFWFMILILFASCYFCFTIWGSKSPYAERPPRIVSLLTPRPCDYLAQKPYALKCYWFRTSSDERFAFTLPIAVFQANQNNVFADPLVYIAGGPGDSGVTSPSSLGFWDDWLSRVLIKRDFVLMDLRGSHTSRPSLSCDDYDIKSKALIKQNFSFAQEYEVLNPILESCLDRLAKQFDHGLLDFTSQKNADDLRAALIELRYQSWNYLGVSYGTRVALVAALTQVEVNRLILDSPYSFDQGKLTDTPKLWNQALARYFASRDAGLESLFWSAVQRLKSQAIMVEVEDWLTGKAEQWLVNDQRFIALVYSSLYSSDSDTDMEALITEIARGDTAGDNPLFEHFYNQVFDPGFSSLLYFATECNDNPLVGESEFAVSLAQAGRLESLFKDDWHWDICKAGFFEPNQLPQMQALHIPVLVASGELDPITPAQSAVKLIPSLTRGHRLDLKGLAHAEFFVSECAETIIPTFLEGGQLLLKCP